RSISGSTRVLSGSNKWSKIRHKKGAKDLERGTVYSAISREILASVRQHPTRSCDPNTNARLASLLRKAKDNGVPKDRVTATLEKANGVAAGSMHSVTYEALGPPNKAGVPVALVIECLTDSVPRTLAKVKELMNRANARLSSTAHLFNRVGRMRILPGLADGSDSRRSFDQVFDVAVEAGATDVRVMEADEIDEELE
ncbi:YebC-like protein, partial [Ceraceosorus guamensis]